MEEVNRILNLSVDDDWIFWSVQHRDPETNKHTPQNRNRLAISPLAGGLESETVELLVQQQRWLADALELGTISKSKKALDEHLGQLVKVLGQHLYGMLFKGSVHTELMNILKDPGTSLRVELDFRGQDSNRLSSWPWEYLYVPYEQQQPNSGDFLAVMAQLVLARTLSLDAATPKLRTAPPVKVLLVVARPEGEGSVICEKVHTRIKELADRGLIQLSALIEPEFEFSEDYHPTASKKKFRTKVEEWQPHVIHFIGHGRLKDGFGELAFVGDDRKADWTGNFAELAARSRELKLVFLQACESALPDPHTPLSSVALQLAHKNIPAVVAMQAKIENLVANIFASRFYQELAKSKSVDYAVGAGREEIRDELESSHSLAFGVPVLYLRSFGRLIDPPAPAQTIGGQPAPLQSTPQVVPSPLSSLPGRKCPNPDCEAPVGEQRFCTKCRCRLRCDECQAIIDPYKMNFCGECGWQIPKDSVEIPRNQPAYQSPIPGAAIQQSTPPPVRRDN